MKDCKMKDYKIEENKKVDISKMTSGFIKAEEYSSIHKKMVVLCHDIFIKYNGGILLGVRENYPVKNMLWPIGGRVLRGVTTKKSLEKKVKEECNLKIFNLQFLGCARTFFKTSPFNGGKGTDTLNLVFYGEGKGKLNLNTSHKKLKIITFYEYTNKFKKNLHPYVSNFMDLVMQKEKKK